MKQKRAKNKLAKIKKRNELINIEDTLHLKTRKEQKGITLIALVITVIVLLILAGVTIATLLGDNGIITRATTAKEKTQEGNVKEQVMLDILEEQMKNEGGNISAEKLKEILEKYFDKVPEASELETKLKEEGFKLKSRQEYGGQEIELGDIYNGDFEKGAITAEQLDSELQQSTKVQYVTNYGIDIDGDDNAEDDWEIFYIEDYKGEDEAKEGNQPTTGKRIFLIASDYVRQDTEELKTAIGSDKANMSSGSGTSEDYVKYWSNSLTYHCTLPNEDGENGKKACTFPNLFEFSNYDIKSNNSKINSKCASSLLCTGNWSSFVKSSYADYATGGPSVEMWVDSWNKRHGSEKQLYYSNKEKNNSTSGYYIGTNTEPTTTYVSGLNNSDPLYFPHKENTGDFDNDKTDEYCYGYWLASPSALGSDYVMYVGSIGNASRDNYNSPAYGVRPVVCLKSDVKLVKSSKTLEKDGIEAECYEIAQ